MKYYIKKTIKLISILLMLSGFVMFVSAQPSINQGSTTNFAILAGSTITNTGSTTVSGDIGLHPGTSITNSEGITLNGTIHLTDDVAKVAKEDLETVYNQINGLLPVTTIASQLGGQTLLPGIYASDDGAFQITGTLTLNADGDPDAIFVFKTASTLITASNSNVSLINEAQHCNVFWKVGSSATFGTGSYFAGNVYASVSATANTGAEIEGKLLAMSGAVTLEANIITNAVCAGTTVPDDESPTTPTVPGGEPSNRTTIPGGELPNTALNLYQIMMIGTLLVVLGTTSLVIVRNYAKNKK